MVYGKTYELGPFKPDPLVGNILAVFVAPVVVYAYLPFFCGLNLTTAYEYLEKRFNLGVRLLGSASFILF